MDRILETPRRNGKVIVFGLWRSLDPLGQIMPRRVATVRESLGQVLARSAARSPPRIPKIGGITADKDTRPTWKFPSPGRIGIEVKRSSFSINNLVFLI